MIHPSVARCDERFSLLWRVLEHNSATAPSASTAGIPRKARWLMRRHPDVMLLADRLSNHDLMDCWCCGIMIRLPGDAVAGAAAIRQR